MPQKNVAAVARFSRSRSSFVGIIAALIVLLPLAGAGGQEMPSANRSRSPTSLKLSELGTFLDDFLPEQMAELEVPGLVFVMNFDGEVALTKGTRFARECTYELHHSYQHQPTWRYLLDSRRALPSSS